MNVSVYVNVSLCFVQVKVEAATAMARGKTAYKGNSPAPIAVVRRNARERNRVKQVII